MSVSPPLARISLHDKVVDLLREEIIEGVLSPGSKLNERHLCERFDVSRTPMREAFKVLSGEGLVQLAPYQTPSVTPLTIEDLDEVFPIMGALEALSGEMACQHIDDDGIAEIKTLHETMVGHYKNRQLDPYFQCNQAIHDCILRASRNETLATTIRGLEGRIRRARYQANMSEDRWGRAVAEHEIILDSVTKRDGAALGDILRSHLQNKLETVRATIEASSQI